MTSYHAQMSVFIVALFFALITLALSAYQVAMAVEADSYSYGGSSWGGGGGTGNTGYRTYTTRITSYDYWPTTTRTSTVFTSTITSRYQTLIGNSYYTRTSYSVSYSTSFYYKPTSAYFGTPKTVTTTGYKYYKRAEATEAPQPTVTRPNEVAASPTAPPAPPERYFQGAVRDVPVDEVESGWSDLAKRKSGSSGGSSHLHVRDMFGSVIGATAAVIVTMVWAILVFIWTFVHLIVAACKPNSKFVSVTADCIILSIFIVFGFGTLIAAVVTVFQFYNGDLELAPYIIGHIFAWLLLALLLAILLFEVIHVRRAYPGRGNMGKSLKTLCDSNKAHTGVVAAPYGSGIKPGFDTPGSYAPNVPYSNTQAPPAGTYGAPVGQQWASQGTPLLSQNNTGAAGPAPGGQQWVYQPNAVAQQNTGQYSQHSGQYSTPASSVPVPQSPQAQPIQSTGHIMGVDRVQSPPPNVQAQSTGLQSQHSGQYASPASPPHVPQDAHHGQQVQSTGHISGIDRIQSPPPTHNNAVPALSHQDAIQQLHN